jgi:hypothetical protein
LDATGFEETSLHGSLIDGNLNSILRIDNWPYIDPLSSDSIFGNAELHAPLFAHDSWGDSQDANIIFAQPDSFSHLLPSKSRAGLSDKQFAAEH